ncbi:MAG: Uma2 family endonuclease [Armatimonadota bacterium]
MSAAFDRLYSPEEYLALEREAETRSELVNGRVYAMACASPVHNQIAANLMGLLWTLLRDSPCRPYGSDQRVGVAATGIYTYPDLSIICPPEEHDPRDPDTLTNPSALVEVLSPSTEAYDWGAKFGHYRRIPSLREYWLVSTDRQRVERFVRDGAEWRFQEFAGPEASVPLEVVRGASISLADLYSRVELPETPAR